MSCRHNELITVYQSELMIILHPMNNIKYLKQQKVELIHYYVGGL